MNLSRASDMRFGSIDGNFDEIVVFVGPGESTDNFYRAVIDGDDDLRALGIGGFAERTGKSFVFIRKISVVFGVRMIKRLELMTPGFTFCDHRLELQWVHRVSDRGCARIRQRVKRVKFVLDVFQAMYVVQPGRRKHHAATFFWKGFLRVPGYLVPRFLREQQYAWFIHRRDLRDSLHYLT